MTCTVGAMAHIREAEPVCHDCKTALNRERRHVNPEATRRATKDRT